MMFTNKLTTLLENQRKRQITALLAVCNTEQRAQILVEEIQRVNNIITMKNRKSMKINFYLFFSFMSFMSFMVIK